MAAPVITSQPKKYILVADGQPGDGPLRGHFSVGSDGESDTYQWYKDAVLIPGATDTSYLPAFDLNDHASIYTCLATNTDGSTLSAEGFVNMVTGDEYWDDVLVYAKLEDAPGTTNLVNEKVGGPTLTSFNATTAAGEGYLDGAPGWVGNGVDSYIMVSELSSAFDCMIEVFFKPLALDSILFRDVNWSVTGSVLQWPQVSLDDGLGDVYKGHPPDGVRIEVRNGTGGYATVVAGKASTLFNAVGDQLRRPIPLGEYTKAEMYRDFFKLGGSLSIGSYDNTDTLNSNDAMTAPDGYSIGASKGSVGAPVLVFNGSLSHIRITKNARKSGYWGGAHHVPPYPTTAATTGAGPAVPLGPRDTSAVIGEQMKFSTVGDLATGTVTYQWRMDAVDLPGETQWILYLVAEAAHDGARVTCVVTDDSGSVTTPYGVITLIDEEDNPCEAITSVTVSVEVDSYSTEPVTYEWYMDEQLLVGYDTATINLPVTSADSGKSVYAKVSNACGEDTSLPVKIPLVCEV